MEASICMHVFVLPLCVVVCVCVCVPSADQTDPMRLLTAAAMDPKYHRILASKLQEHANNYQLTDVSFR